MRHVLVCALASLLHLSGFGQAVPDESSTLQARIDALPAGGTLVLEGRAYHCEDLQVSRPLTIQGVGREKTVLFRNRARPFFKITGRATEVTIRELGLDGGGLEAAGIEAEGIKSLRLRSLRVERCGITNSASIPSDSFGRPVDGVYAKDVDEADVEQCVLSSNARDGFIGIPVRHLRFVGNLAKGNGRMGCTSDLDPEHKAGGPLSVVYRSNEVIDCGTGGLHVESEEGLPVAEALFEGNRIIDCGNRDWGYSWGLVIGNHSRGTIRGNTIEGTGVHARLDAYRNGIHLDLLGGPCLVENNTIKRSGRMGISIARSPFPVRLSGNMVQESGKNGISAYQVEGLQMLGCTVTGAGQSGLWLRLCASAEISGNRFTNNSQEGPGRYAAVHVESSLGLKVVGNDLGGPPHKLGLELDIDPFGSQISFEGNLFQGQRKHPLLSSFRTEN